MKTPSHDRGLPPALPLPLPLPLPVPAPAVPSPLRRPTAWPAATRALAVGLALLAASPAAAAKKPLASGERIDVSRASVVELMRLPGVGRKKAEAIAALRSRAPQKRLEDLLTVKGISRTWLEKHRAQLALGGAAAPVSRAAAAPQRSAR